MIKYRIFILPCRVGIIYQFFEGFFRETAIQLVQDSPLYLFSEKQKKMALKLLCNIIIKNITSFSLDIKSGLNGLIYISF